MENTDRIKKFLAYEGKVNVVCANTTYMIEEARKTHDLSPVATAALGRMITISAIMGADLKDPKDKITVQIKADGPIGGMVAVASNSIWRNCRGFYKLFCNFRTKANSSSTWGTCK